jgi:hypothetical protein
MRGLKTTLFFPDFSQIGIFLAGFDLEYRMIYGHSTFQKLFRTESNPEMRFGPDCGSS